jgi:hypothetical protein
VLHTLKCELDSLAFLDGESIIDFGARLGRITNQLVILGFESEQEEVMTQFLQALPPKFEQITTSIETLLDLESVSVDELIGRLKPIEERLNRSNNKAIASLNLTDGELEARVSSLLKISGNGGSGRSKEAPSRCRKWGHGHGRGRGSSTGGRTKNHSGGDSGDRGGNTSHNSATGSSDVVKDQCVTMVNTGIGLVSAGRRREMRRLMLLKWMKRVNPLCFLQAPLLVN